jgi:peptidoglycan/xylan/chitin deacetylase (PgdA/CDA1 family)
VTLERRTIKRYLGQCWPEKAFGAYILVFHSIGAGVPASMKRAMFLRVIDTVRTWGSIVPLTRCIEARSLNTRVAAITFDDGYEDNYLTAFPLLAERNIPFTLFVTTAFVDGRKGVFRWSPHYRGLAPLSWQWLRAMQRAGVEIGSHTVNHPRLAKCNPGQLNAELSDSKRRIEDELGTQVIHIAYPFGQDHDVGASARDAARVVGYHHGFTTIPSAVGPEPDMFAIPRIVVDVDEDEQSITQKLLGRRRFMLAVSKARSLGVRAGMVNPTIPDRELTLK